ncbi:MAG: hypothetical protein M1824_002276 [Vezdaea acicularis]|nr:MAG: hypothetical protein M1824_002276 [Vezdaea acicularis]
MQPAASEATREAQEETEDPEEAAEEEKEEAKEEHVEGQSRKRHREIRPRRCWPNAVRSRPPAKKSSVRQRQDSQAITADRRPPAVAAGHSSAKQRTAQ